MVQMVQVGFLTTCLFWGREHSILPPGMLMTRAGFTVSLGHSGDLPLPHVWVQISVLLCAMGSLQGGEELRLRGRQCPHCAQGWAPGRSYLWKDSISPSALVILGYQAVVTHLCPLNGTSPDISYQGELTEDELKDLSNYGKCLPDPFLWGRNNAASWPPHKSCGRCLPSPGPTEHCSFFLMGQFPLVLPSQEWVFSIRNCSISKPSPVVLLD